MNFIDLCGTHTARCTDKTGEIRLLLALGFQKIDQNLYELYLPDIFLGKCGAGEK